MMTNIVKSRETWFHCYVNLEIGKSKCMGIQVWVHEDMDVWKQMVSLVMFTIGIIFNKSRIPCIYCFILLYPYFQNSFKFFIRRNAIVKWAYFYNFIMAPPPHTHKKNRPLIYTVKFHFVVYYDHLQLSFCLIFKWLLILYTRSPMHEIHALVVGGGSLSLACALL